MNLHFHLFALLLLIPLIPFVKKYTSPIFILLSLRFSPQFSKTSRKRITSYINMFSLPPLYQHSSKRKLFLTFPILNNFAPLKKPPSLVYYRYSPYSPFSISIHSNSHFKYKTERTTSILHSFSFVTQPPTYLGF